MDEKEPSLELLWNAFTGYQRTAALKAAVELEVFTYIAGGSTTIDKLADRCHAAKRGLRALLNYLVIEGFLTRSGDQYGLSAAAAFLLDNSSPAYVGSAVEFIASPMLMESFARLTDAVRLGGTAIVNDGTLSPENPVWVQFARAMAPLAGMTAALLGNLLEIEKSSGAKVLDVAAGHGMFGIGLAQANPNIEVTAQDWQNVLAVAKENARKAGVESRFKMLPGSAFDVSFGDAYDFILLPNFLHHFDPPTCQALLAKCRGSLKPSGKVVIVEFVPDAGRSGPSDAVQFGLVMLATTPAGDAYTFDEYTAMLKNAGFGSQTLHDLPPSPARVVIASR